MGGAPDIWLVPTLSAVLPSLSEPLSALGIPVGVGRLGSLGNRVKTGVRCHVSSWITTMSGMTET